MVKWLHSNKATKLNPFLQETNDLHMLEKKKKQWNILAKDMFTK